MSSTLTVSQLNRYIKSSLQGDVRLKNIFVKGEITNFKRNFSSGHIYFSLKDEGSLIRCVMFSRYAAKLKNDLSDGTLAVVSGGIEVYEAGGVYQIIVTDIMPIGVGSFSVAGDILKAKLAEKGYFKEEHKKQIPEIPQRIGVVASPFSAAVADIKNILGRRYPIAKLFIFSATVQGEKAPESIAHAIAKADKSGLDTVIIARGGGSVEDLSCFNAEIVADAVYSMETPCISAVGHETDVSIIDLIADKRAPTPSAAAEIATPDMSVMASVLSGYKTKLDKAQFNIFNIMARRLDSLSKMLGVLSPKEKYIQNKNRLEALEKRLKSAHAISFERKSQKLSFLMTSLEALSPLKVLARGYSLVTDTNGTVVADADRLNSGDDVKITFSNGERNAKII